MTYYLDTSALAKRYLREPGSDAVRALIRRRARIVVSRVAVAELSAAVAAAWRRGAINEAERDRVLARIERDVDELLVLEVRSAVVRRVVSLVVRAPLRAYDAVQVASALELQDRGAKVTFWCADGPLAAAARATGLRSVVVA